MPNKLLRQEATPLVVTERLLVWGRCIRTQRVRQGISVKELCSRIRISDATLRRLDRGDPGAGIGSYLSALQILGLLDLLAPVPDHKFWDGGPSSRARTLKDDDGYF